MRRYWHNLFGVRFALLGLIFWGLVACADVALEARLRRLPTVVGENRTVSWKQGETWVAIGIREHVGYEHLRRANSGRLTPGRELFIAGRHLPAALVNDGLVLNLPELTLFRWKDGKPITWYPVSIGMVTKEWHTPVGTLSVVSRIIDPYWYRENGTYMAPGPKNPLGERWVGLSRPGYGIHGTNDPSSIGRTVSHGCIRLYPQHVFELFPTTWLDMPVVLVYETLTVGSVDNIVYLAVFPDVYSRGTNTLSAAKTRLAGYGLAGLYTDAQLQARLRQQDGVARPVLGSTTPVTLNGANAGLVIGPTLRNDMHYLAASDFARAVGGTAQWEAERGSVTLTRHGWTATLTVRDHHGFVALDTAFFPVRALTESLGGTVTATSAGLAIRLPDGR